ncbi:hypothetical protein Kalk_04445 [Ketobacter alkanivorans]|uniref:Uncharacterized protein n=1 Tax=Ketobacter alkanivorans TaxID=1917421 RepID=A0A2K9LHE8_9GAMM|nr:hypothetical protein Kalk_04445 [Ketobacter alkanivorans]
MRKPFVRITHNKRQNKNEQPRHLLSIQFTSKLVLESNNGIENLPHTNTASLINPNLDKKKGTSRCLL